MLLPPKYTASLPINFTSFPHPVTQRKGTHTTQEAQMYHQWETFILKGRTQKGLGWMGKSKNWFQLYQINFPTKFAIPGKPASTRQVRYSIMDRLAEWEVKWLCIRDRMQIRSLIETFLNIHPKQMPKDKQRLKESDIPYSPPADQKG